jgi:hypothetical protein
MKCTQEEFDSIAGLHQLAKSIISGEFRVNLSFYTHQEQAISDVDNILQKAEITEETP